jgi:pyruvoyl-dependent arginine decarboxylase (PvlArgDC)
MIHWVWLIWAVFGGFLFGVFAAGMMKSAKRGDELAAAIRRAVMEDEAKEGRVALHPGASS